MNNAEILLGHIILKIKILKKIIYIEILELDKNYGLPKHLLIFMF